MGKTGVKEVKALFFDVDGTLISYVDHRIHPEDLENLRKLHDRGMHLFIASGRDLYIPVEANTIREAAPLMDGFISANGQRCHLSDGTIVSYHPLLAEDFVQIRDCCKEHHIAVLYYKGHESYITEMTDRVAAFSDYVGLPAPDVRPIDPELTEPQKICVYISPEEEALYLKPLMKHTTSARNSDNLIDLIPGGIGKDSGIRELCAWFGIDPEATMAFGDGENDIPMLRAAGIGVAMGIAEDKVKTAADFVTDSAENAGISKALAHFGLI